MLKSPSAEFLKYLNNEGVYDYSLSKIPTREDLSFLKQHRAGILDTSFSLVNNLKESFFCTIDVINSCDYELFAACSDLKSEYLDIINSLDFSKVDKRPFISKIPLLGDWLAYSYESFVVRCEMIAHTDLASIANKCKTLKDGVEKKARAVEGLISKQQRLIQEACVIKFSLESVIKEQMCDHFYLEDDIVCNDFDDIQKARFDYFYFVYFDLCDFLNTVFGDFKELTKLLGSYKCTADALLDGFYQCIDLSKSCLLDASSAGDALSVEQKALGVAASLDILLADFAKYESDMVRIVDKVELGVYKLSLHFSLKNVVAARQFISDDAA